MRRGTWRRGMSEAERSFLGSVRIPLKSCCQATDALIFHMSIAEIRRLSLAEKLQIMEGLWEDLRSRAEDIGVPKWHKEMLDARRKAVESGQEKVLEWDEV